MKILNDEEPTPCNNTGCVTEIPQLVRRNYVRVFSGLTGFLLLLVFSGWFASDVFRRLGETQAREHIQMMALSAAVPLAPRQIASLTGSTADENKEEFINLKDQLARIRRANDKFRFVYIMALKDGGVVFLVDAEQPTSKDYSAPGDPYDEASSELLQAFETGEPFVEGSFKDQWGEWVSGHAPIFDPETGSVLALIGIDIDANVWRNEMAAYRWLGIALVGVLFAIGLLLVLHTARINNLNVHLQDEVVQRKHSEIRLTTAHTKLRMKERELSSILRNTPDVIYRLNEDGDICFISEAVNRYGCTPEDLIGRNILEFVHPDDQESAQQRLNERRTGERGLKRLELRLFEGDGTEFPAECVSVGVQEDHHFLVNAEGIYMSDEPRTDTFVGTQGVARDITERKRAEEEIHALRGIIPICTTCKKIRDDAGYWHQVEAYVSKHSEAEFSHGACPECLQSLYPDFL